MNQLTIVNSAELVRQSSDIAGLCRAIVVKSAIEIQGRKYVRVEGWMSIATAHGCIASARDVQRVEGGYRAIGELRQMGTGAIICEAEGFVGEDETTWYGGECMVWDPKQKKKVLKVLPKRPDYAIRAMAQTRAVSRVCRSAFAHVVVLMDAGLSTTPAEEVPREGFDNEPHQHHAAAEPAQEHRETGAVPVITGANWRDHVCQFGKPGGPVFGKKVGEINSSQLEWFADKIFPKWEAAADRISANDRALFAALRFAIDDKKQAAPKAEKPVKGKDVTKGGVNAAKKVLASLCEMNNVTLKEVVAVGAEGGLVPDGSDVDELTAPQLLLLGEKFEFLHAELQRRADELP